MMKLGSLAKARAVLTAAAERLARPPDLASDVLAGQGKLLLMQHGLARARERVFDGIECQDPEPWRLVFALWDVGRKTPWHDPDDRADQVTITSSSIRGAIVGRRDLDGGRIYIVSALTLKQYANNVCWRWTRAEDRFLR